MRPLSSLAGTLRANQAGLRTLAGQSFSAAPASLFFNHEPLSCRGFKSTATSRLTACDASSSTRSFSSTSSNAFASASSSSQHDKVYELRIYDFQPSSLGDFMKLSNENFHLRTKHSKLLGYWFTEFGGANQVGILAGFERNLLHHFTSNSPF